MIINELPSDPEILAWDIEVWIPPGKRMVDPYRDQIAMVSLCDGRETYILTEHFERLKPLLEDPTILKILHNGSFDIKFLKRLGINTVNVWDTLIIERVLTAGTNLPCGLGEVVMRRGLGAMDKSIRETFITHTISREKLEYSARDAEVLVDIYEQQRIEVEREQLGSIVALENSLVPVVADMELRGIGFDAVAWGRVKAEEEALAKEEYQRVVLGLPSQNLLTDLFGNVTGINLNSPLVLKQSLVKLGIEVEDTKESTLQDWVEKHALKQPKNAEILEGILKYREHDKATQFDYLSFINPVTKRIHCSLNQMGAETSRFSATDPNLQQVKKGARFREIFIAEEGKYLVTADYNQLQLRIMADVSNCKNMISAFTEHRDLHAELASQAYGETIVKGDPRRDKGKGTNFAKIFGAAPDTVAWSIRVPLAEAKKLCKAFDKRFPEIETWGAQSHEFLAENGYLVDICGRKRWFPELSADTVNKYRNIARNTPIQTVEATLVKRSLVEMSKRGLKPVLCVHDEILIQVEDPEAKDEVKEIMEKVGTYYLHRVPMVAEAASARCWKK